MIRVIDSKDKISMYEADNLYKDANYLLVDIVRQEGTILGRVYAISDDPSTNKELLALEEEFSDKGVLTFIGGEYKNSFSFAHLEMVSVA